MLPPDFHWRSVASRPDGKDDSVFCDGTQVLRLSERINGGGWFANLNTQRPERERWTTRERTGKGRRGALGHPTPGPATGGDRPAAGCPRRRQAVTLN